MFRESLWFGRPGRTNTEVDTGHEVEPALLTEFRSEGGEAQVSAGFVANRATQS